MKLKLLIVPFFVIMSLVIGIGMIKPDYDSWVTKKRELTQKRAEVDRLESLRANIDSLTSNLDQNKDLETFMLRFYPLALDQERVIDAFNFISTQSGLTISAMDIKELVNEKQEDVVVPGGGILSPMGESAIAEGADGTRPPTIDGAPPMVVYVQPEPDSFTAQVKVKGSYENIKSFFARLYKLDRMHELRNITVSEAKKETNAEGEEVAPSGILEASFEAKFSYVMDKDNTTAMGAAVFGKSSFDIEKATSSREWASTSIAELNVDNAGRPNPFQ
jgi:Tfp pilus assembly protein PilO